MFLCEFANHITKPGQKMIKVVTQRRPMEYVNKVRGEEGTETKYTRGWEIVKETKVCEEHFNESSETVDRLIDSVRENS